MSPETFNIRKCQPLLASSMREVVLPTVGWQSIIWQRLYKSNLFILFGSLHKCILLKWNYVFAQNVED